MPKPEQENPGGPSEITSSGNRIGRRVQELLLGAKENWALLVDRDLESPHLFLGITTKNIQNLIAEIQKLGFALGINQLKYSMLNRSVPTISILPLLEKAAVQDVGPEDVRP